jgi:hypothetical protein
MIDQVRWKLFLVCRCVVAAAIVGYVATNLALGGKPAPPQPPPPVRYDVSWLNVSGQYDSFDMWGGQ